MTRPSMSNIIIAQDLDGLAEILNNGWRPKMIKTPNSGYIEDHSVWLDMVISDWDKGLNLLFKKFPASIDYSDWWLESVKYIKPKVCALLWDRTDATRNLKNAQLLHDCATFVIKGLGDNDGIRRPREEDVIKMVKLFSKKGFDITFSIGGAFADDDLSINGHSVWTRAVVMDSHNVINKLMPTPSERKYLTRMTDCMFGVMRGISGDRSQILGLKVKKVNKEELELFKKIVLDESGSWFFEETCEEEIRLNSWARPVKRKISPWFRVYRYMPKAYANAYWKVFTKVCEADKDLVWLHYLAMYPNDNDVKIFFEDAVKTPYKSRLSSLWFDKNNQTKLSPASRWSFESPESPQPFD